MPASGGYASVKKGDSVTQQLQAFVGLKSLMICDR